MLRGVCYFTGSSKKAQLDIFSISSNFLKISNSYLLSTHFYYFRLCKDKSSQALPTHFYKEPVIVCPAT